MIGLPQHAVRLIDYLKKGRERSMPFGNDNEKP